MHEFRELATVSIVAPERATGVPLVGKAQDVSHDQVVTLWFELHHFQKLGALPADRREARYPRVRTHGDELTTW